MKGIYLYILFFGCLTFAQQTPGKKQQNPIIIENATIHQGNGTVLNNAYLAFENGKITYVGTNRPNQQANTVVINAENQHIYPGFIAANSILGLTEIDAVQATQDSREIGSYNAQSRALIAYNSESKIIETIRPNGILLAQITPKSGIFSGMSSVVQLDAWNWKDAAISMDEGLHLNWPILRYVGSEKDAKSRKESHQKRIEKIYNIFNEAKVYKETEKPVNQNYKTIQSVLNGEKTLYVHADFAYDIWKAIQMKKEFSIPKMVIVGGYDALMLKKELREENIPVLVGRVHELPKRRDDDINSNFKLPHELYKAGILVGLENYGDMPAMNSRNYPFYVGSLIAYGMKPEDALKLVTSNTAKILGIDEEYGTIEVGKSATFFISNGDAFDIKTNDLTHAFIDGRMLNLNTFQKDLYEKFRKKLVSNNNSK